MATFDVKELRQKLGLSQQQFALLVGASVKTISNWENGGIIPASKIPQLEAIGSNATLIDHSGNRNGDNSMQVVGDNSSVSTCSALDKAMDELAAQRRMLEKSQQQIDRLITLLEDR